MSGVTFFKGSYPEFEQGIADAGPPKNASFFGKAVAAQFDKLSDAGGFKFSGCPTQPEPISETRADIPTIE